jgi:hypothetical protein
MCLVYNMDCSWFLCFSCTTLMMLLLPGTSENWKIIYVLLVLCLTSSFKGMINLVSRVFVLYTF